MSSPLPPEFMILVERVVRPLPLPLERQKRLRDDYLEHLQDMYAEELAHQPDPAEAMNRVQRRLGNPAELTAELRQGIRWWELWQAKGQAFFSPYSQEPLGAYAGRMTGLFFVITAVLLALIMIDHHVFGVEPMSWLKIQVAGLVLIFMSSWVGGLLLFGLYAGEAWRQKPRRWLRVVVLSAAHLASWPLSLILLMRLAEGSWSDYSIPLTTSVAGGMFSVVCGMMVGTIHSRDAQYRAEWSALTLDAE